MNDQVLPKHQNPDQQQVAHAPYNFIPLPDIVVKAVESADGLPDHDCGLNDRHTGNLILVTHNTADFAHFVGLCLENWFEIASSSPTLYNVS